MATWWRVGAFAPSRAQIAATAAGIAFVLVYPLVLEEITAHLGVRGMALCLLVLGGVSWLGLRRRAAHEFAPKRYHRAAFFTLSALALFSEQHIFLLFLPALFYAVLGEVFLRSLRSPYSLIERGALQLHPYAPEFIRPYCRKATAAWAMLFLLHACIITALAVFALLAHWQAYTGWIAYTGMLVFSAIEFLIRKLHFRYYVNNHWDRLFAFFFPAQNTATGRLSQAYIARMREEIRQGQRIPPWAIRRKTEAATIAETTSVFSRVGNGNSVDDRRS